MYETLKSWTWFINLSYIGDRIILVYINKDDKDIHRIKLGTKPKRNG